MKKFKSIDVWISITSFITLLVGCFVMKGFGYIIISYLIIGSWQLTSMIVHAYNGWFNERKSRRRVYHWFAVLCLVTMPVGSCILLTFLSPVMAVYYTWLCYDEVYVKMQRPLNVLK